MAHLGLTVLYMYSLKLKEHCFFKWSWVQHSTFSYNNNKQIKLGWALFVTYTIIQSIMRSEMCSLHLTHPSVHTWSSGQPTVQRPGSSCGLPVGAGIRTHNLGLPRVSSPTLYPLGQRLPIHLQYANLMSTQQQHTLTGHFIKYTLLVPDWTHFCLQNCLNSSWHRFKKVLETFLRDFGPYWHESITRLLQICRLHIHGCESPVPPHPKDALLDWDLVNVEAIWVKWTHCHVQETSLRWFELCDMVHYPAGSSIRRWEHCSHKGMDMVSNNTQVGCGV